MKTLLLASTVLAAFAAAPASAGVLGIDVLDNGIVIDSLSGITVGTADITTSDAAFANISVSVEGAPVLPNADLSSVALVATSSSGFTGTHDLTIEVFQTDVSGHGPTSSTFTVNGLVGGPGPTTESTFEGGTTSTLGTLLATHSFAASLTNASAGPIVVGAGAFTADAQEYSIAFTNAHQSFGGSVQLTTNIPEPATWAMMIAGFALLTGLGLHRRKITTRLAAL